MKQKKKGSGMYGEGSVGVQVVVDQEFRIMDECECNK
jgi:hypothetical protein